VFDRWEKARGFKAEIPNKFTVAMGKLVREARQEAKLTQGELAEKAYMRQATVSDIENGKREATTSEVVYLSGALEKPIGFFYPIFSKYNDDSGKLTDLEQELLLQARKLSDEDLRKIVAQVKALAEL
jgi:transcriptional regulator with XRE-family HTH domain